MTYHFLKRVFEVNKNGMHHLDGISALNLIIVMFENMEGMLDNEMNTLMGFINQELDFVRGKK